MDCVIDLKLNATPLHARFLEGRQDAEPVVVRLTDKADEGDRSKHALLLDVENDNPPPGFSAYLLRRPLGGVENPPQCNHCLVYSLPKDLDYLAVGDVIRINPRRAEVWVMYRQSSKSNSLLLTERCNSWCVMCSQPPKPREDDALVRAWLEAIPLISPQTEELGFTGGEPTLLGELFLDLVAACRDHLPSTAVHVLSNGRLFNYLSLAEAIAAVQHHDLVIGVPVYSDIAWRHDFIVQAPGAFDQTIRGLLNLARCAVRIEVRIVIHRQSADRLPELAAFIARNLPFVEHVALMGLEPIGFAKSNLRALWVDPIEYQEPLCAAVDTLAKHGMNVSIYNHQLCVLPHELWPFSRQSISDWKNVYLPQCGRCGVRKECGGFFHSAASAYSRAINPIISEISTI